MFSTTDFENVDWHDNAIHAFRILEGEDGGELVLDIDFIAEWLPPANGAYSFRVAPSDLTFHEVSDLVISINYAVLPAAVQPMIIHTIHRESVAFANGHSSFSWKIELNWPSNSFSSFESRGFTQVERKPPVITGAQYLSPSERNVAL